jgi:hypothetical protein
MKKTFKYLFFFIFFLIIIQTFIYYKNSITGVYNLKYYNIDNELKKVFFTKKNNYVLYFDPSCDFCSEYLKKINNNEECSLVLITPNKDVNLIKDFIKKNNLSKNNVFIDKNNSFSEDFGIGFIVSIPTLLLINEKNYAKNITDDFLKID